MIVILDYGMGNLGSIQNMLKKIGADAIITSDLEDIERADKLILPGVGAFDHAMMNLQQNKMIPVLEKKILTEKVPLLGICLGMQILGKRSDEGLAKGLGWIDAVAIKFKGEGLRVPHMGWNTVKVEREDPLFESMFPESRFYFVHSYYMKCASMDNVLTSTNYGGDFCSSLVMGNIWGVQYHPEKSHKFGMLLLKNFSEME